MTIRPVRGMRTSSQGLRAFVALCAVVLSGTAALNAIPVATTRGESIDSFVTRSGTQLLLSGQPYRFSGANIYNANSDGWCGYQYTDEELTAAFDAIGPGAVDATTHPGGAVVRAWFFQSQAASKSPGGAHLWSGSRDWTRFDRTLAIAREKGVRVMVTLTDQWGECGDGPTAGYKSDAWYRGGYTVPDPIESALRPNHGYDSWVSYLDWVQEVVSRYRDRPEILAWQLINEGEAKTSENGSCPADATSVMAAWASDVSTVIRNLDPNHLISLGTIGTGQCGASFNQYSSLHNLPNIDLCEFHDYTPAVDMPGDAFNGLQKRVDQCNALGKPVFVGEVGIKPAEAGGTLGGRRDRLAAKMAAQSTAGVTGHLAWVYSQRFPVQLLDGSVIGTRNPADYFDIGPGDPALLALAKARVLQPGAPTGVTASRGDGEGSVSWSAPGSDGGSSIFGYTVTALPGGSSISTGPAATSAAVTGLTNGTSYTFTVRASNVMGLGPASAPSNAITPITFPTLLIAGVVINAGDCPDCSVAIGDAFDIAYTFDPDAVDTYQPDGVGIYEAVTASTITIGSYSATGTGGTIAISNKIDANPQLTDRYIGQFPNLTGSEVGGLLPSSADFALGEDSFGAGDSIPSEALITTPLDMSAFSERFMSMTFTDPGCGGPQPSGSGPEPSGSCIPETVYGMVEAWTVQGAPGSPRSVTAAGGDGSATVAWLQPLSQGAGAITQYAITSSPGGFSTTTSSLDRNATFTGLSNGTSYTFAVKAINAVGTGPSSSSGPVTPTAGAPPPQTTIEAVPDSGGTAATDPAGTAVTASNPLITSVTVPPGVGGGVITIAETTISSSPPSGFVFLEGQQVLITSSAATSALDPLSIVFKFDPALSVVVFRNGIAVGTPCSPAGTATPSPCIAGSAPGQITILTATASTWNVGMRTYVFGGFFSPVDNQPVLNVAKAGSNIPVKFSLGGDRGLGVLSTGYPTTRLVACDTRAPVDGIEETVGAGVATLSFNSVSGVYQYSWKTQRAWAGTCRELVLQLLDGTTHRATFSFK